MLSLDEKCALLKGTTFFAQVEPQQLETIAKMLKEISLPANTVLFQQDDVGDALYILVEGRVGILRDEIQAVTVNERGFCIGEMALLDDSPRSATIKSITDTRLLQMNRDDLMAAISTDWRVIQGAFKVLNEKIRTDLATQAGVIQVASGILEHINRGLTERAAPNLDTMLSEMLKEVLEFVGISSAFIVRRNDDSELHIEGGIGSFADTGVAEAQLSRLDFDIFSTDQRMYTRDLLILPLSSHSVVVARTNIQILPEREDLLRIFLSHVDAFTRNMQLEAKIREQENLALVGSVAGRIISDLKQPISTIKMASQMQSLKDDDFADTTSDSDVQDLLEMIDRAATSALESVQGVLEYVSGDDSMMPLPIRVDEFLDSLLSDWVPVLYGADIQFAQHGEVDAMLNLDTERMSRAFGNILKNAIDAVETSDVKQIDLFISDEGDSVNFVFKDSGVGIPSEIMGEIFLPFKTGNDLSGGPGLGLTIAKSIIESHGGKIWCVSEQGEGAEFYCALPKSEPNDGEDDLLL